jgi:hypothetical protein
MVEYLSLKEEVAGSMPATRTMKFKSPAIHRTPLYRAKSAYSGMKRRCGNRWGTEPAYAKVKLRMSLDEWLRWAIPRYERFLRRWPDQSPCASRRGDRGHYEIGNIEIISAVENRRRQHSILLLRHDGTKLCGRCRKVKIAENNFVQHKNRPDGLSTWCKACTADYRANLPS